MLEKDLLESNWSERVSNDPKHRPQILDRPSTTVRKEWCRRPQEAHLADGMKYRRLSVAEIARIQSFPAGWVDMDGLTENERIAVLGNAVPPMLSRAIADVLKQEISFENHTLLEICAGIGGLSFGFDYLSPLAKIELWDVAARVLRTNKPWPPECVVEGMAQEYDYKNVCGKVGLLCGGPPCQPWSQAGCQRGANDPRDVMGFTPTAIAECEPEVFLFENVPGLFTSGEHKAYVADLLKKMASPKAGLRYGVASMIINAADYGVPQIRRRVLILGVRGKSNTFANRVLNKLSNRATHHDPAKPAVGKTPWVTLRQAFEDIPVTERWIKWKVTEETLKRLQLINVNDYDEDVGHADDLPEMTCMQEKSVMPENSFPAFVQPSEPSQIVPKLELMWPGKNNRLVYSGNRWRFTEKAVDDIRRALLYADTIGSGEARLGSVVVGDYLSATAALAPFVPSGVQMFYFDSPRLSVLEGEAPSGYAVSTWLSIVHQVAVNSYKSLKKTGFFVLHTDEEMAHYGRQVLDEVFGRKRHVTTFAWQKKYSPQNDKTKTNPTDAFDYIIVYSKCSLEDLPKIGILEMPDKIIDDGDWRGCYTAGHKGAKSGNEATKFHVNAPPYRWRIKNRNFPEGRFWFDEITGVLWFENVAGQGDYSFDVSCTDSKGHMAFNRVLFSVRKPENYNDHFKMPERIWWLLKDDNDIIPGGDLEIVCDEPPIAVAGEQYCIVLKAKGGVPFTMNSSAPGTNRYWEFSKGTLIEAIATTTASFGTRGSALPSRKTYYDRSGAQKIKAVTNWLPWQDYGKSEDASRHVKALQKAGITAGELNLTAKPQRLLAHLITLLAPEKKDVIVSLGDMNAVMASVAMKMEREFIHITGASTADIEAWNYTGRARIAAVMNNLDAGNMEKDDALPFEYAVSDGYVDVLNVSRKTICMDRATHAISIAETVGEPIEDFYAGLLGAYRRNASSDYFGFNGRRVIVFDSEDVLDAGMVSYISGRYSSEKLTIVAERIELPENAPLPRNISVLHAPFELIWR